MVYNQAVCKLENGSSNNLETGCYGLPPNPEYNIEWKRYHNSIQNSTALKYEERRKPRGGGRHFVIDLVI
jgi:hypothetical protein